MNDRIRVGARVTRFYPPAEAGEEGTIRGLAVDGLLQVEWDGTTDRPGATTWLSPECVIIDDAHLEAIR